MADTVAVVEEIVETQDETRVLFANLEVRKSQRCLELIGALLVQMRDAMAEVVASAGTSA